MKKQVFLSNLEVRSVPQIAGLEGKRIPLPAISISALHDNKHVQTCSYRMWFVIGEAAAECSRTQRPLVGNHKHPLLGLLVQVLNVLSDLNGVSGETGPARDILRLKMPVPQPD